MQPAAAIRFFQPGDEVGMCEAHLRSIREICSNDYPAEAIEVWAHPKPQNYLDSIANNNERYHVVDADGKIAGFSGWYGQGIIGFYMHPEYVGQGLAAKLFRVTEDDFLAVSGLKTCHIESTVTAQPFYQKMGFETVAPAKHTFHDGKTTVDTWKMIKHY